MAERRARAWLVTSNNPEKHYSWAKIDYSKAQAKDYAKVVQAGIDAFVKGGTRHPDREEALNAAIGVFEVGDNGTPHTHHYFSSKNPIRFSALQKKFPHSDVRVARGTVAEIQDYLHKRRKHKDKAKSKRCEPVYWGECLVDNRGLSGNGVFDEINALLADGHSPADIYALSPKYAFYASAIERTYNARTVSDIPPFQDVYVEYHTGASGTGKTHNYRQMCEGGMADEIYLVSGDYKNPWDGYDFAQHSILFLDELRGNSLEVATLLNVCDGYRMTLPARYANKHKNWSRVIISTVLAPEDLFHGFNSRDSFEQFKRRLDIIVFHYIDPNETGGAKYKTISIPAEQYVNYAQLEAMAKSAISSNVKKKSND